MMTEGLAVWLVEYCARTREMKNDFKEMESEGDK